MSLDIFLEYLIDSTSSMPIFLDEDMLSELEDSWRWRHLAPDCLENTGLILNWTRDILVEPDVLGIEDSEFNEVRFVSRRSCSVLNVRFIRDSSSPSKAKVSSPTFVPLIDIAALKMSRTTVYSGSSTCFCRANWGTQKTF